jgi:hypothetical protein
MANLISGSLKAAVIGQLLMNLLLGGLMQQLFSVMNKL